MAEVYKGLTIQIGADASELESELKKVSKAASTTQQRLKEITKSLKTDPSNVALLSKQLELTGAKAGEAGTKLKTLQRLESAVSDATRELAQRIGNSATALQEAKEGYNKVNSELSALNKKYAEAGLNSKQFLTYLSEQYGITMKSCKSLEELRTALNEAGVTEEAFRKKFSGQSTANTWVSKMCEEMRELDPLYKELSADHAAWQKRLQEVQSVSSWEKLTNDIASTKVELKDAAMQATRLAAQLRMVNLDAGLGEKFTSDLRTAGTACEKLVDECQKLKKAAEIDSANLTTFRQAAESTKEAVAAINEKLTLLKQKLVAAEDAAGSKLSSGMLDLERETEKATSDMAELQEKISAVKEKIATLQGTAQTSETESAIKSLESELTQLTEKYNRAGDALKECMNASRARELATEIAELQAKVVSLNASLSSTESVLQTVKNAGYGLYSTVTPALTMVAYEVVQRTEEIDSAYRDMRKTLNATEQQYEQLYSSALSYSTSHVTNAADMLETEALLAQVGISAENIESVAQVVSNLDIATSLDADELSTQLGQLVTTMKFGEDGAANFGDALVRLGNNMATNETQIMDVLSYMGSAATLYGFTADEALGWAAAMASTGQGAEASGGAFSRVMAQIETATASGGDSLKAFAETAGMTSTEFAKLWSEDPSSAMQALVAGLADIDAAGGSVELTLQELGITNTRDKQLMRALTQEVYSAAGGQGVLQDALQMSKDAWDGVSDEWGNAGDAANEADKKAEGFSGTLSKISNNLDVLTSKLGDACVPILNVALSAIQGLTEVVESLPSGFVTAAEGIAVFVAAIGPVAVATTSVIQSFRTLKTVMAGLKTSSVFNTLATGIAGAATGAKGLATTLLGLGGGSVALGLGTIAASLAFIIPKFQAATARTDALKQATEGLSDAAGEVDFSSATSSTEDLTTAALTAKSNINETTEAIDSTLATIAGIPETLNEANAGIEAQSKICAGYIETLKGLSDADGIVSAENYAAAEIALDGLNAELGTNYSLVANSAGAYQIMSDNVTTTAAAIESATDATIKQAEAQAKLEAYNTAVQSSLEAQKEYYEALAEYEAKYGTASFDADGTLTFDYDAANGGNGLFEMIDGTNYSQLYSNVITAKQAWDAAADSCEYFKEQVIDSDDSLEESSDLTSNLATLQDGLTAAVNGTADATADATAQTEEEAEAAETLAANIETATQTLETLNTSAPGLGQYLQEQGYSIASFAEQLTTAGYEVDDFVSEYEDAVSTIQSSSLLSESQGSDAATRLSTQAANNEFYAQWQADLATLKEYAANIGDESARAMAQAYVSTLEEEGTSSETAIQGFIADPSTFDSMVSTWGESYRLAGNTVVQKYIDGLNEYKDTASAAAQELFTANTTAAELVTSVLNLDGVDLETQVSTFYEGLSAALANGSFAGNETLQAKAQELVDAYSQGVNNETSAEELSEALNQVIQAALSSTDYSAAETLDVSTGVNVNPTDVSVSSTEGTTVTSSEAVTVSSPVTIQASSVDTTSLDASLTEAGTTSGAYLSQGVADGITASASTATSAATDMGTQAVAGMNTGLGVASPSTYGIEAGGYLAQGVANGITSSTSVPVSAAQSMADQTRSPLSGLADNASEWGYHLGYNFASGISSSSTLVSQAASAVASAASAYIKHTVPKKGPLHTDDEWGGHLVDNFTSGMVSNLSDVRRAAYKVACAADVSQYESAYGMASGTLTAKRAATAYANTQASMMGMAYDKMAQAVSDGVASSAANINASVYVDGRRLASATSQANNKALGKLSARKER